MTRPLVDDTAHGRMEFASRSDIGRVRARNEDVFSIDPACRWALLADGMGGYRGGDVAAQMGVDTVLRRLDAAYVPHWSDEAAAEALAAAIREANAEIYRARQGSDEFANMGSTLVATIFLSQRVVSAHVGDSRLYRLREQRLVQLTRDHSVVQSQIDAGVIRRADARHSPARGLLMRGLGVDAVVLPELGLHTARAGDTFLMCSDGLTDMLEDDEIAAILHAPGSLDAIAAALVDAANLRGGRDNVTVIVARMVV